MLPLLQPKVLKHMLTKGQQQMLPTMLETPTRQVKDSWYELVYSRRGRLVSHTSSPAEGHKVKRTEVSPPRSIDTRQSRGGAVVCMGVSSVRMLQRKQGSRVAEVEQRVRESDDSPKREIIVLHINHEE